MICQRQGIESFDIIFICVWPHWVLLVWSLLLSLIDNGLLFDVNFFTLIYVIVPLVVGMADLGPFMLLVIVKSNFGLLTLLMRLDFVTFGCDDQFGCDC